MNAQTVGELVSRDRRSSRPAVRDVPADREVSYRDFCTMAQKAGNFLSHLGVRRGVGVAVAPDPAPEPLLAFAGAALLGAVTRFDPTAQARAVVVPAARAGDVAPGPGTKLVVYGASPDDPGVAHWERDVWSENPASPPSAAAPDDPVLGNGETHAHRAVLSAAGDVVDRLALGADDAVALRSSLADPRAVVAGVVAPLLAGGTVVFPGEDACGDVSVGEGPEVETFSPDDVGL